MKHLFRLFLLAACATPAMAYRDLETGAFLTRDPIGNELMNPDDVWIVNGQKFEAKPSQMSDPMMIAAIMNGQNRSANPTQSAKDEKRSQIAAVMNSQYGGSDEGFTSVMHAVKPAQPNLYTYVNQNPWTMFDPLGLDAVPVGDGNYKFVVNPANFGGSSLKDVQGMVAGKFVAHPNPGFSGECATGAQYLTGTKINGKIYDSPSTSTWTKGAELSDKTEVGTMVAWGWNEKGKYPNGESGNHTAIYAGKDSKGRHLVTEQNVVSSKDAPNGQYHTRPVDKSEKFYEVNSREKHDRQPTQSSVKDKE